MLTKKITEMKKQIVLTTLTFALAAGSIFAFVNKYNAKTNSKAVTENCPPNCCIDEDCCVE